MNPMPTTPEAPAPAPAPMMPTEPKKNPAYGTILGIVLIVVILVVGAFYVWGKRLAEEQPMTGDDVMPAGTGAPSVDVDVSVPQPQ